MPEPSLDVSWGPHLPWPGARPGARDLPKEQGWVLEAQGPGGGGVAVRGWVGGVWAQPACLPRLQQETPPWGSLTEGLRVPSLP